MSSTAMIVRVIKYDSLDYNQVVDEEILSIELKSSAFSLPLQNNLQRYR